MRKPAAIICRERGWMVGTRIVGDGGFGPTVIEITAIGESEILARLISHKGNLAINTRELAWVLDGREWQEVPT